jgi:hypothetical protein
MGGPSPYPAYSESTTAMPSITWPNGAKPMGSRFRLSMRLMNTCVDRVFGADMAA